MEANPARAAFVGPTKAWWKSAITTALAREGWQIWEEKLTQLDAPPNQILIGMEATSRYAHGLRNEMHLSRKMARDRSSLHAWVLQLQRNFSHVSRKQAM